MKTRGQNAFRGFYAVTLITLLAICCVIATYALIYWTTTQQIQQTISKFGTASAVSSVTMPAAQAGQTETHTEPSALTVDIQKTGDYISTGLKEPPHHRFDDRVFDINP